MAKTASIRDLGLAAALVTAGFKLITTEKQKMGRTYFIFACIEQRGVDLDVAADNYWNNYLDVDARRYFENIKMLKSRIYSER